MFYISSNQGDIYGITDTSDGVEEFYSKRKLIDLYKKGINIIGITCYSSRYYFELQGRHNILYKPISIDSNNNIVFKKFWKVGCNTEFITNETYNISQLDALDKIPKVKVDGKDVLKESAINAGYSVVFITDLNAIIKTSLYFWSKKSYGNKLSTVYLKSFNTSSEALNFCIKNNLTISNELSVKGSDEFWSRNIEVDKTKYLVDQVLIYSNFIIPLWRFITCDCVSDLDHLFSKANNKNYCTTEFGSGFYNTKGKVFHFTPYVENYTLSFELGSHEPDDSSLRSLDYKEYLKKYGLCVTRASMHSKKKYKSDIEFYAK